MFDVYTGEQVGAGRRSLALALSFRALDRTLTDDDVAPVRGRIVAALGELGVELRVVAPPPRASRAPRRPHRRSRSPTARRA